MEPLMGEPVIDFTDPTEEELMGDVPLDNYTYPEQELMGAIIAPEEHTWWD
jgi:hypothetical protein